MPPAAIEMANAETHESRARNLRETLSELASKEAPPKALAQELNARLGELDQRLDELKGELLERFDSISFVALRASIPRSVESHRKEVVALLEVLLCDRDELLERLPRVEYLITMLSTEEDDGRRHIVHDPATLTSSLEDFSVGSLARADADAIAMELYQAAELDSESENFHGTLRSLRERKQDIGLGCLSPVVLRAVVTYNARMFNSVESLADASRASDSMLDEELSILEEAIDSLADTSDDEFVEEEVVYDKVVAEEVAQESETESVPSSVFESEALDSIIEAVRRRLQGGTVGRRGPEERIAIILDQGSLESLETEAILAESPSPQEDMVARTTIVGLMLRDPGPLQGPLESLGIAHDELSDVWIRELNESFGQMLSGMLADPKAYEMTSRLSGIKTKHLLKPIKALNAASRGSVADGFGSDDASAEMRKVARAAAGEPATKPGGSRSIRTRREMQGGVSARFGGNRTKLIAAAALVTLALALGLSNVVGLMPSDVETVTAGSLRITSPYLQSAYRNEDGRGGLMIGRVDSLFVELPIEGKIEAAEEMVENFAIQGIREAMFYDSRGMMQVHYSAGLLHRPRPGDRSTGRAPGEAAVRRTLSGERLEDARIEKKQADDRWRDDS